MPSRILAHFCANLVAYVALFVALGGSSYAAVRLAPGSVHSRALAKAAVTRTKLAKNSVTSTRIRNRTLTSKDFKPGAMLQGFHRDTGRKSDHGAPGPTGAPGPPGRDGNASLGAKMGLASSVTAPHGASTGVALTHAAWTQSAGELDLVTGSVTMQTPSACTGSFGNSLLISIDGKTNTFAVAPSLPASSTVTVPFLVGTMSEPDSDAQHSATAQFANTCTKSGEDYTVNALRLDVITFR